MSEWYNSNWKTTKFQYRIYLCNFFRRGPYIPEVDFLAILSKSNGLFLKININLKSTTSNINYPETRPCQPYNKSNVGEDTNLQFQQVHKQQQEVVKQDS